MHLLKHFCHCDVGSSVPPTHFLLMPLKLLKEINNKHVHVQLEPILCGVLPGIPVVQVVDLHFYVFWVHLYCRSRKKYIRASCHWTPNTRPQLLTNTSPTLIENLNQVVYVSRFCLNCLYIIWNMCHPILNQVIKGIA